MLEDIKKILSKLNTTEKIILFILMTLPLFFSLFTFLLKFCPTIYEFLPIKNYTLYLILFVPIALSLMLYFFIFRFFLIRNKKRNSSFFTEKWSILDTLFLLIKNRTKGKKEIYKVIIILLISFYIQIFTLTYIINYGILELFSSLIFIFSLFFFTVTIYYFLDIVAGFQDGYAKKIVVSFVFLVFLFYYLLFVYTKLFHISISFDANSIYSLINSRNIILTAIIFPLALYIFKVLINFIISFQEKSKKISIFFRKRRYDRRGWNKILFSKFEIFEYSLAIFTFTFLNSILLFIVMLIYFEKEIPITIFAMYIGVSLFYSIYPMIIAISFISKSIIYDLFEWNRFFIIYQKGSDSLELTKLIKISGECTSISYAEELKDIIPDFDQQFIIKNNINNTYIQVVRLKELTPFIKHKLVVREHDKIIIIGTIRKIYENLYSPNVFEILIAYHIEPVT